MVDFNEIIVSIVVDFICRIDVIILTYLNVLILYEINAEFCKNR
jgi:hypothetical protein